ncbi:MAG: hypothetical protein RLZZ609_1346 [Cyanobacteriota bacterium]|jgi:hypothetical protein
MRNDSTCSILSFDYLDFDVYLNTRTLYTLAGFKITPPSLTYSSLDLLVVLRGIPTQSFGAFSGVLHVFDYVRELSIDYSLFFPNASEIVYVSLVSPSHLRLVDRFVYGYVPVFPPIWRSPSFKAKDPKPVHIANYKPMNNDSYQQQLVNLIHNRSVNVYGAKWDRININAAPVSYLTANYYLSKSLICFGLMYPYQRGKSLSGRMWQAPLQGCLVISEAATNIFDCPGIVEVTQFSSGLILKNTDPLSLSIQASNFWFEKTLKLAADLHLSLDLSRLPFEVFYSRILLIKQHLIFCFDNNLLSPAKHSFILLKARTRSFVKKLLN